MLLVFDFGGGTLDVTVVQIESDGSVTVKTSDGNPNLGGQDIDNAIIQKCIQNVLEEHKLDLNQNTPQNAKSKAKLRKEARSAKELLSADTAKGSTMTTEIVVDGLHPDLEDDFSMEMSKAEFNEICATVFNKIEPLVD